MYHFIIKKRLQSLIRHVNEGDFGYVVRQFGLGAEHYFVGSEHALAGARHSPELIEQWYKRLGILFPDMKFEIKKLFVSGFPWKTYATIEVQETSTDRRDQPMSNEVVLLVQICWGRATELHIYCDTARLQKNLAKLVEQGVSEAALPPISDINN